MKIKPVSIDYKDGTITVVLPFLNGRTDIKIGDIEGLSQYTDAKRIKISTPVFDKQDSIQELRKKLKE